MLSYIQTHQFSLCFLSCVSGKDWNERSGFPWMFSWRRYENPETANRRTVAGCLDYRVSFSAWATAAFGFGSTPSTEETGFKS